jgi:hypothetical protein
MAKLVWQPPGEALTAYPLRLERVAIGRDAGNDIRLPEPAVSSRHAVIITRLSTSTLHDLNSSNGSWINGRRVESQQLHHGDKLQIGRLEMQFIDEALAVSVAPSGPGSTHRNATVTLDAKKLPPPAAPLPPMQPFATPAPPQPGTPDFGELDRLIGSIRSYRSVEDDEREKKRQAMQSEWNQLLVWAAALKQRLANEPRVRYFDISARRGDISIRIVKRPNDPPQALTLTWGHMDQTMRHQEGIWLREPGQSDRRYETCNAAARDLLTSIAHLLA